MQSIYQLNLLRKAINHIHKKYNETLGKRYLMRTRHLYSHDEYDMHAT